MLKIMMLLGVSMCLAYCSQKGILCVPIAKKHKLDIPMIIMIVIMSLFVGLRTEYNDTTAYIADFAVSPTPNDYLNSSPGLLDNPLFHIYESFFRHSISDNPNLYLLTIGIFCIASFVRFIRRHSVNFAFSILMFFSIGLFVSCLASVKQCVAMAVLTYAIEALLKRKYLIFYLFVFIAMLFHTYAILFIVLPIFTQRPWTVITYLTIIGVIFVLLTFETTITSFLDAADEAGKTINDEHVFKTEGINLFRLAVFSVPFLISLVFQDLFNPSYQDKSILFINMSILSFLIMSLGLFSAANLFGRSAIYFELGTIIIMPWIIKEMFAEDSQKLGHIIVGGCYMAFFAYSVLGFSNEYSSISLGQFINSLL